MNLKIETDFIYVADNRVERLDGVWNNKRKAWKLPNTLGALRELYQMEPMAEIQAYGIEKRQHRDRLLSLKGLDDAEGDSRLRSYQRVDVNYLKRLPAAGIFSEMRTGKSPTALKVFEEEGRKKNCIVCPASLVLTWSSEVKKWTDKTPYPVKGTKKQRMQIYNSFKEAEEGYLIISKDSLRSDINVIETL